MISPNGKKHLCSWFENEPYFYGQKVNYIGVSGLGGYRNLLNAGWVDKRDFSIDKANKANRIEDYLKTKKEVVEIAEKISRYDNWLIKNNTSIGELKNTNYDFYCQINIAKNRELELINFLK